MTFTEYFGSSINCSHSQLMENAISILGFENLKTMVPFSIAELNTAYHSGDIHLNSLPLDKWDKAAGYRFIRNDDEEIMTKVASPLTCLFSRHKITSFSCSEGVSLLKSVAVKMIKESEVTSNE